MKWGLLSTARINRRLIPAIRAADRAELHAVASRDLTRAERYAAEWDIPRAHGSYLGLLEDPEIDVVYISLPNSLHAEWAVCAAQVGKHVLCEKPLALSVAECELIAEAGGANGVVIAEGVMSLYHPLLHRARQLVNDGAIGEVILVRGAFSFPLKRPKDVRWEPGLGGGSLWDVGSYPVSFIRWIAGDPDEVFGWQILGETGVDSGFAGLLRYESGVLGSFECGFQGQLRLRAEIVGADGVLVVERPYVLNEESQVVLTRGDSQEVITLPAADPYQCEVESLTAAVLEGAPLAVSLASSRANVSTLVALYESARSGRAVPVSTGR